MEVRVESAVTTIRDKDTLQAATDFTDEERAALPEADETQGHRPTIRCDATLFTIGSWTLLRLPKSVSAQLPSRGMTMVEGTINGARFQAPLEPDGKGSHWFRVDDTMRAAAGADAGDTVMLEIEPSEEWPEPAVPADLKNALTAVPQARTL